MKKKIISVFVMLLIVCGGVVWGEGVGEAALRILSGSPPPSTPPNVYVVGQTISFAGPATVTKVDAAGKITEITKQTLDDEGNRIETKEDVTYDSKTKKYTSTSGAQFSPPESAAVQNQPPSPSAAPTAAAKATASLSLNDIILGISWITSLLTPSSPTPETLAMKKVTITVAGGQPITQIVDATQATALQTQYGATNVKIEDAPAGATPTATAVQQPIAVETAKIGDQEVWTVKSGNDVIPGGIYASKAAADAAAQKARTQQAAQWAKSNSDYTVTSMTGPNGYPIVQDKKTKEYRNLMFGPTENAPMIASIASPQRSDTLKDGVSKINYDYNPAKKTWTPASVTSTNGDSFTLPSNDKATSDLVASQLKSLSKQKGFSTSAVDNDLMVLINGNPYRSYDKTTGAQTWYSLHNGQYVGTVYNAKGEFTGYNVISDDGKTVIGAVANKAKQLANNARNWANIEFTFTGFRGLGYFSKFFMDKEELKKWQKKWDERFSKGILGGTEAWAAEICSHSVETSTEGTRLVETPEGMYRIAYTISGERSSPIILPGETAQYFYHITFYVQAGETDASFNVYVENEGSTPFAIYEDPITVAGKEGGGETLRKEVTQYSNNYYTKVSIKDTNGNELVKNTIVESNYSRDRFFGTIQDTAASTSASTSQAQTPRQI